MTEAQWVRLWTIKPNNRHSQRIPRFPGYNAKLQKVTTAVPQDNIVRLRELGMLNEDIGAWFGISRERVRQRIAMGWEEGLTFTLINKFTPEQIAERQRQEAEAREAARAKQKEAYVSEILGKRYGTLVVRHVGGWEKTEDGRKNRSAKVECDCGVWKVVSVRNLKGGNTRSCGSKVHNKRGWTMGGVPANVVKLPDNYVEKVGSDGLRPRQKGAIVDSSRTQTDREES